MSLLPSAIISGLGVGLLYGLLGFSVVTLYKASATLSFAQPAIGMFTAFLSYLAYKRLGLSPLLAVGAGLVAAAALGWLLYAVAMRPNDSAGPANRAFRTLAIYSLLLAVADVAFSAGQPFAFPIPIPAGHLSVGSGVIPILSVVTLVVAGLMSGGLLVLFTRTRYGLLFRAVADDREVARLLGIRARRITALAWVMGAVIACVVALLTVPSSFVSTETLANYAVYALAGVFLGGLTSWIGTFLGGIIIGVISNVALVYLNQEAAVGLVFLVLLGVLTVRPRGILGSEAATRV